MKGSTINLKVTSEGLIQIPHEWRLLTWLRQSLKGKQPLQGSDQRFPNARQQQICVYCIESTGQQSISASLLVYSSWISTGTGRPSTQQKFSAQNQ